MFGGSPILRQILVPSFSLGSGDPVSYELADGQT